MKILVVSSYLPYPLLSGGQVRLYNLIKELSGNHEITLICEKRPHQTASDISQIEKFCKKVITVERKKQWSIKNIMQAGFSTHSFLVTGHTHHEMMDIIAQELAENAYDAIHVETFYVMQNLLESGIRNQELGNPPIILVEHNIEHLVYKRFIKRVPVFFRPLLALDIAKMRREEESYWAKAGKVVAVSEEEQKFMAERGIKAELVPNGVNLDQFQFKEKKQIEKKILFIGDFAWIQNRDTVSWIIKEIWPKIKKVILSETKNLKDPSAMLQDDNIKLWIVGREIPDSIKRLTNDQDVLFDEESSKKSAEEIFQEAFILLAPIRVGGGTSYKILESMSCGTPVVTMNLSAKALGARDGEELLVGENPEELAAKTVDLLKDDTLYEKISKGGRELIEKKYSWKEVAKTLEQIYNHVIASA